MRFVQLIFSICVRIDQIRGHNIAHIFYTSFCTLHAHQSHQKRSYLRGRDVLLFHFFILLILGALEQIRLGGITEAIVSSLSGEAVASSHLPAALHRITHNTLVLHTFAVYKTKLTSLQVTFFSPAQCIFHTLCFLRVTH